MLNFFDDVYMVFKTALTKRDYSFGVIPVSKNKNKIKILLVESKGGSWGLPKGHKRFSESDLQTALRELKEETGISKIEILDNVVLENNYKTHQQKFFLKTYFDKTVKFYIGFTNDKKYKIPKKEIKDIEWLSFQQAIKRATYPNTKKLIIDAQKIITSHLQ